MKPLYIILLLLGLVGTFLLGYHCRGTGSDNITVRTDTVIQIDTLRERIPVPSIEIEVGEVEIPYPVIVDGKVDTIYVPVPITQKEYATENYHAWVSGYSAALDSIDVFPKTVYITKRQPASRWGLGIIGGYGIGRNGLSPYLGVGVYYRIW